jgi:uncharacterized membrane protein YgdD (TMEM256/DUF423 family)
MRITPKALTVCDVIFVILAAVFIGAAFMQNSAAWTLAGIVCFAGSLVCDVLRLHLDWRRQP